MNCFICSLGKSFSFKNWPKPLRARSWSLSIYYFVPMTFYAQPLNLAPVFLFDRRASNFLTSKPSFRSNTNFVFQLSSVRDFGIYARAHSSSQFGDWSDCLILPFLWWAIHFLALIPQSLPRIFIFDHYIISVGLIDLLRI